MPPGSLSSRTPQPWPRTAQLPSHCRKECIALTTEFSSRRLGLMRSSWELLPHPHGASGLVSRKGSPHPAAALLWPHGGAHTPGGRGPPPHPGPGGADYPHTYPRGPAAGHLAPLLWTDPPLLLRRARRGPTHEPFTPQSCSRIPHQTPRRPAPQCRVTKDGSHPLPGIPAGRPSWGSPHRPPKPLSSVFSVTQGLQGYWLAIQDRVPPPPPKPSSLSPPCPAASRLPSGISESVLSGAPCGPAGQSLILGCRMRPSPSILSVILFRPSSQETTHPSPAGPAAQPAPGCCTSRLALPSTAAPALSTRPVSPRAARGPLKGSVAPFHRFGN